MTAEVARIQAPHRTAFVSAVGDDVVLVGSQHWVHVVAGGVLVHSWRLPAPVRDAAGAVFSADKAARAVVLCVDGRLWGCEAGDLPLASGPGRARRAASVSAPRPAPARRRPALDNTDDADDAADAIFGSPPAAEQQSTVDELQVHGAPVVAFAAQFAANRSALLAVLVCARSDGAVYLARVAVDRAWRVSAHSEVWRRDLPQGDGAAFQMRALPPSSLSAREHAVLLGLAAPVVPGEFVVVVAGPDGAVELVDVSCARARLLCDLAQPPVAILPFRFALGGDWAVACVGRAGHVVLAHVTAAGLRIVAHHVDAPVEAAWLAENGATLCSASSDGHVRAAPLLPHNDAGSYTMGPVLLASEPVCLPGCVAAAAAYARPAGGWVALLRSGQVLVSTKPWRQPAPAFHSADTDIRSCLARLSDVAADMARAQSADAAANRRLRSAHLALLLAQDRRGVRCALTPVAGSSLFAQGPFVTCALEFDLVGWALDADAWRVVVNVSDGLPDSEGTAWPTHHHGLAPRVTHAHTFGLRADLAHPATMLLPVPLFRDSSWAATLPCTVSAWLVTAPKALSAASAIPLAQRVFDVLDFVLPAGSLPPLLPPSPLDRLCESTRQFNLRGLAANAVPASMLAPAPAPLEMQLSLRGVASPAAVWRALGCETDRDCQQNQAELSGCAVDGSLFSLHVQAGSTDAPETAMLRIEGASLAVLHLLRAAVVFRLKTVRLKCAPERNIDASLRGELACLPTHAQTATHAHADAWRLLRRVALSAASTGAGQDPAHISFAFLRREFDLQRRLLRAQLYSMAP